MLTAQAVTGAHGILVGYTALALVYAVVGVGVWWVLRRLARAPLPASKASLAGG
jgi:cytochrome d ubiquinol oxidase subunit I